MHRGARYDPPRMHRCARWPVAVFLLGSLAGCGGPDASAPRREAPRPPRTVRLATATTVERPRAVQVSGTLQAQDELVLGFQVPGRMAQLDVDFGDVVAPQQLLAALERTDFELDVARAEAAWAQARAQLGREGAGGEADTAVDVDRIASVREAQAVLDEAALQRGRAQELVAQQLKSPAELDAANATWEVARSRLQRARDQVRIWQAELDVRRQELEVAKKRLDDTAIRAPWAGRVAARHAAAGQYLAVGAPVLTLLRTDPLRLRLEVPELAATNVRPGQQVEFTVDGADGAFTGKVTRLGSAIDRSNRTLTVEAEVDNREGRLRAGGFCRASIVVALADQVVVVPQAAIASFAGVDRVFTVADGKAVEHLITAGRTFGDHVEIVDGLAAGAEVVLDPRDMVQGAPVAVEGR